jgi:hypothetical protein
MHNSDSRVSRNLGDGRMYDTMVGCERAMPDRTSVTLTATRVASHHVRDLEQVSGGHQRRADYM